MQLLLLPTASCLLPSASRLLTACHYVESCNQFRCAGVFLRVGSPVKKQGLLEQEDKKRDEEIWKD
jgi:hypothetical protein